MDNSLAPIKLPPIRGAQKRVAAGTSKKQHHGSKKVGVAVCLKKSGHTTIYPRDTCGPSEVHVAASLAIIRVQLQPVTTKQLSRSLIIHSV